MEEIVEKWFSITQNTSSYLSPHVQELVLLEKGITTVLSDDQNNKTLAWTYKYKSLIHIDE